MNTIFYLFLFLFVLSLYNSQKDCSQLQKLYLKNEAKAFKYNNRYTTSVKRGEEYVECYQLHDNVFQYVDNTALISIYGNN